MLLGIVGPIQILLFFIIFPVGLIFLAFYLGKKSGYKKGLKESVK
jgi:mannose/fructose/N-acetylgalactosamine-specific phosphotransferase system component IID